MMPPHYRIECVKPEPIPDPLSRLGKVIYQGPPFWRVVRLADGGTSTIVARKPTWAEAYAALVRAQIHDAIESYPAALIHATWVLVQRWRRVGWNGSNDPAIKMLINAVQCVMEERRMRARAYAARRSALTGGRK